MNLTKEQFVTDFQRKLKSMSAKPVQETSLIEQYNALGELVREYLTDYWIKTNDYYHQKRQKQVYYFSMEFLTGKFLVNNLENMGIFQMVKESLTEMGIDLDRVSEVERDQGLGNGGLGRLAACFLDSMSSLAIPGHGIGIRYRYGLFEQKIIDGYQVEFPDRWLHNRNVWEVKREDKAVMVKFEGHVRPVEVNGKLKFVHENYEAIRAVPYDTPMVGYDNNTVNTLRLWSAEAAHGEFDYSSFSRGEYIRAFEKKHSVESISQVLYPNDSYEEGKLLRLKQEYFFVSAGLQGIMRSFKKMGRHPKDFHEYVAIHINDTHPAVCVPELMRILIDEENLDWDTAWHVTKNTMAYTNHTIMQEALEKWPVELFRRLLPRVYMIVEEINRRFCDELWHEHKIRDLQKIEDMAIIARDQIHMAFLAIVGSHSVNGVAKLHTEILKKQELKDFYKIYPYKFNNKTNGITHRRWLIHSNPELTGLINETLGTNWQKNPILMRDLLKYREDASFKEEIERIKQVNKDRLAAYIAEKNGVIVNPRSIFDVQAKRLHEYKRQILNVLHIMDLYNRLRENPNLDIPPRTFLFAAKAAPSYHIAKQTIKLINTVAEKVNNDPIIRDKIKVVFLENYGVSLA